MFLEKLVPGEGHSPGVLPSAPSATLKGSKGHVWPPQPPEGFLRPQKHHSRFGPKTDSDGFQPPEGLRRPSESPGGGAHLPWLKEDHQWAPSLLQDLRAEWQRGGGTTEGEGRFCPPIPLGLPPVGVLPCWTAACPFGFPALVVTPERAACLAARHGGRRRMRGSSAIRCPRPQRHIQVSARW